MIHYWVNIGLVVLMIIISLILLFKSSKITVIIQSIGLIVLAIGVFFIFYPIHTLEDTEPKNLYLVGSGGALPDSISLFDADVEVVYEDSVSGNQESENNQHLNIRIVTPWNNQYKLRSFLIGNQPVAIINSIYSEPPFVTNFYPIQNNDWSIQLTESFYNGFDSISVNYDEKVIFNSSLNSVDSEILIDHKFTSPGPVELNFKLYNQGDLNRESKISLNVKPVKRGKIALFTRYPNSEFNTLLRWLKDKGFEYFYRTEISKDRFINKKAGSIDSYLFNDEWLDQFDLFIISSDAFNTYQWSMLTDIITKKGKGLIITGDNKRGINIP
ncbi:hypothetical protein [Mangrovivirga cuniculi]|uniref:Uncharacterized protein n=1 Tax=Mangrovivirga cuniculi TaxID=2715131 RepID=A0A4D7K3Y6_9BACT|nr:hypothetical protein [Mangrovivirga cuniculi]QCK15534.1 hypothetical protein DCC35_12650 [Mangrovivirga cuniculi]